MTDTTAGYEIPEGGEDRRKVAPWGRRQKDAHVTSLPIIATVLTIATVVLSFGISWGAAQVRLSSKVDRDEQLIVDASQSADILSLQAFNIRLESKLDSANARLKDIYCDGKPVGCR